MVRKTVLSQADARRLLRHMAEDPPNSLAKASLERGREALEKMAVSYKRVPPMTPSAWKRLESIARERNDLNIYPTLLEAGLESMKATKTSKTD